MTRPPDAASGRRRLSPEEARSNILAAAAGLVSRRGLDGLRIRDVAKACGINHATLLHHIAGREALLVALAQEVVGSLAHLTRGAAQAPPRNRVEARAAVMDHLELVIARMSDHPGQFELLTEVFARASRDPAAGALAAAAEREWIAHLRDLLAPFASAHDPEHIGRIAAAITLLVRGHGLSPSAATDTLRASVKALLRSLDRG